MLINRLFTLGICIHYDRLLEMTKFISETMILQFERDGVFLPSVLKKDIFTMIAKDNVDINAKLSTASKHFNGTSMSVLQFPSRQNKGHQIYTEFDLSELSSSTTSRKAITLPASYAEVNPISTHTSKKAPLFAPVCTYFVPFDEAEPLLQKSFMQEVEWLENTDELLESEMCKSWAQDHSLMNRCEEIYPGINAILPLITKEVHTIETRYQCMMITRKTINKLNPQQTPIDVADQPVYALSKEIQWRFRDEYGQGSYFVLFGGLHIEQSLLKIHGDIIKGSGMEEILNANELSIIGSDAIVNVNQIKKARYSLQIAICAI